MKKATKGKVSKALKKVKHNLPENLPAVIEPKEISKEIITESLIKQYMDSFGIASGLTANEQMQFIKIAEAFQLNPFKREIYVVPYMSNVRDDSGAWIKQKKLSIITGYEVYLKRATRLNTLSGWNAITEGTGENMKAIITINRRDWQYPFKHEVDFKEYYQDNKMWKEKPKTMLKKVVTAQGFRLCFPDEMGGMPYTSDELPDTMTQPQPINVTPEPEPMKTIIDNTVYPVEHIPPKKSAEKQLDAAVETQRIDDMFKRGSDLIEGSQTIDQFIKRGPEIIKIGKALPEDKRKTLSADYLRRKEELEAKEKGIIDETKTRR